MNGGKVKKNALYDGRHTQNLISHCQRSVRIHDEAAAENLSMADSHRQMVAGANNP